MIKEIIMPKLGETMEEGYIAKWFKNEGDKVAKGEVLFEVMSDKTNFEIESFNEGYLRKIVYQASEDAIPVTTVIGYISDKPDEDIPVAAEKPAAPRTQEKQIVQERVPVGESPAGEETGRIKASPVAKRLAGEMGIDLSKVKGTGEAGRIEKKDVLAYKEQAAGTGGSDTAAGDGYEVMPWTKMRKIIADKLTYSKQNIPHYYLSSRIQTGKMSEFRQKMAAKGKKFTYTDLLIFSTAKIIGQFPLVNAAVVNNEIRLYRSVDIGLAVGIESGLIVPVLKDLKEKKLEEIAFMRENIAKNAKDGKLSKEESGTARFVISNLGMFGVRNFAAIISPPGTAIMAVGSIEKEPVVAADGKIVVAETMWITLSLDHRIVDGVYGGKFLQALKNELESEVDAR